ncbi:hypothetical protein [Bacillus sp. THAF10]|uniref:hypothetical protein n=1 Tax=Bacillus sp. THAF10 TaxID=2587848 RepID=UPI001C129D1D|nr:hypothetical protein [Bacillus sp. THAF10]
MKKTINTRWIIAFMAKGSISFFMAIFVNFVAIACREQTFNHCCCHALIMEKDFNM